MFALDPTPAERFKQVLRQLSSSRESIQQATKILMDNVGDSEELFSILMKRLRKMSAKRRLPLFYLVDSVCQISKSKQHAEYRELTAKYLIEIIQLVVPDEGEARSKAFPTVHKVLGLWKERKVFGLELLKRARRKIEPTDKGFEDPTIRRDRSFCTDKSTEEIMKHVEEWRRNEKRNRWESALRPVNDKPNAEFEEAWEKFHQQEVLPPRPLDPHDHRRVPIRRGLGLPGASVSSDPSEIDLPIMGMEPNHLYIGELEYVRHPDGFPSMANSSDSVHVSIDGVVDMDTSHSLVTRGPAPLLQPPQPNQPPKMYRSPSSRSGSPSGSPHSQSFPPFPFQPRSSKEFTPPIDSPNLIGSNGMVGTSGMVNLAGSSGGMGASMESMMVDNNGMSMDMRMGMEGQDQGNFQQGNFNQNSQFEGGSLGGSMDGMNMMPMMNPNMMNNMGMGNMGPMAMNPMMNMNNNMGNMNGIGMSNMNNQMGMNMNMGMNMGMNMMGNGMMNPMGMNMMNNMGMNGMGMNGMGMNGMQMGMNNNMMGMGMMNNNGNNMYNNTNNNNMYGFNNNNSQQEGFYQPTTDESPSSTTPTPNQTPPKPLPPSSKPSPATSPTNTTPNPSPTVAKPTPGTPKIAGKPPAIPGKPAAAVVKKPAPVVTAKPPVQKLKAAPLDKPTDDKSPQQSPHTSPRQSPHSSPLNKPPQPQGAPSKPLPPLSKIPPSPSKPFAAKAKPLSKLPPFHKPAPAKPAASPVASPSPSPSSSPSPSPSAKPAPTRPMPQELKQAPHEFKIAPKPQLNTTNNSTSNNNPGLIPDPLQSSSPNTNDNNSNNNNNNTNSNNNSNTVSNSSQVPPPTRQDAIQTVDMSISPSSSPTSPPTFSNPSTLNPGDQQSQENKSLTTSNALT